MVGGGWWRDVCATSSMGHLQHDSHSWWWDWLVQFPFSCFLQGFTCPELGLVLPGLSWELPSSNSRKRKNGSRVHPCQKRELATQVLTAHKSIWSLSGGASELMPCPAPHSASSDHTKGWVLEHPHCRQFIILDGDKFHPTI